MRVIGSSQFYMIIFLQLLTYFILHYRIVIKFILTDCLGLRNKWSRMNVSDQKHLKTDQNHLKIVKTISIKQGGVDQNYLNNFQLVLVYLTTVLEIRITKHSFGPTSFLKLRHSFRMNLFIILSWSVKFVNNCRKIIIKNWLEPIIRIIKNGKIKLRLLI